MLDSALLQEIIGGHDRRDSTSIPAPVRPMAAAAREGMKRDLKGMRIGLVKELGGEGFQPGVQARFNESVKLLEEMGAEIVEVSCPHFPYSLGAYYIIMPSEVSSNLARYDGMRYRPARHAAGRRAADRRQHDGLHLVRPASATRSSAASSWAPTRCPPATTTPGTVPRRRCAR